MYAYINMYQMCLLFYVCIYRIKIKRRDHFIWHLQYAWPAYFCLNSMFEGILNASNTLWMRACACLRVCVCLCCGFVVYFNVGQLMSSVITRIDHVPPHIGCSLLIFMINFVAQWGDTVCTHTSPPPYLRSLPRSPFTWLLMYSL